jgi:ribosomal protein L24E
LGNWVISQRAYFKAGKLSDERIALLDEVGFAWEINKINPDILWKTRFDELVDYKQQFGNCNVSREYEANPQLFYWVKQQRSLFKQGKLANERIEKLDEVGFSWGRLDFKSSWMSHYNELVNHKQEFGDCIVPCKLNSRLGEWAKNQRCLFNKGKLSQDRIAKLNEIGFVWGVRESQWMAHFYELKKFKRKFGHCDVPCAYKKNPQLGRWVENQRAFYKKGIKITEERIAMLNEAGFKWVIKEP